nr:MAG TPA: hypothetical protein [Caudoviricetes sp.]
MAELVDATLQWIVLNRTLRKLTTVQSLNLS